jgi:hypothetical protein
MLAQQHAANIEATISWFWAGFGLIFPGSPRGCPTTANLSLPAAPRHDEHDKEDRG